LNIRACCSAWHEAVRFVRSQAAAWRQTIRQAGILFTDEAEGLVPPWLRFLRVLSIAKDLPLNISREIAAAQSNAGAYQARVTKKVLGDLIKFSENDAAYAKVWDILVLF